MRKEYEKTGSVRLLSRKYTLDRKYIRKLLIEEGTRLLSSLESIQLANLKFEKTPCTTRVEERAYMYGFVLGDVHVHKKSSVTLRLVTHTTHETFVDLFKSIFERYGHVYCRYIEKSRSWRVSIDVDSESFSFLYLQGSSLPELVKRNFLSFLAGFVDADGSIILRKSGKYFQYIIRLCGEDGVLLKEIISCLQEMGISCSFFKNATAGETRVLDGVTLTYNHDYYAFDICRKEEVIRLLRIIPLRHEEKIKKKDLLFRTYSRHLIYWDDVKSVVQSFREQIRQKVQARS